jgi:hypothetical protein
MNEAQRAAFRITDYRVDAPAGELLLKVDQQNAMLADVLRSRGADCAAVITAFNPQARLQEDAENRAAQALLERDLDASGHDLLPGRNEDPTGHWPVEESFLVPGLTQPAARELAARYGQLAFLWIDASNATPRLIETAVHI